MLFQKLTMEMLLTYGAFENLMRIGSIGKDKIELWGSLWNHQLLGIPKYQRFGLAGKSHSFIINIVLCFQRHCYLMALMEKLPTQSYYPSSPLSIFFTSYLHTSLQLWGMLTDHECTCRWHLFCQLPTSSYTHGQCFQSDCCIYHLSDFASYWLTSSASYSSGSIRRR